MQGYGLVGAMEIESAGHIVVYKLHELKRFHSGHVLQHAVQAGTLVAHHRILAVVAGSKQGALELVGLALCNIGHALALPYHAAAQLLHACGIYHLPTTFLEEGHHLVDQVELRALAGATHSLIQATGEVHHLPGRLDSVEGLLSMSLGQRRGPQRGAHGIECVTQYRHALVANHGMGSTGQVEGQLGALAHAIQVMGTKVAHLVAGTVLGAMGGAQVVGHVASVDLHGARRAAQAVGCTGVVAVVLVERGHALQAGWIFTRGAQACNLALRDNALA